MRPQSDFLLMLYVKNLGKKNLIEAGFDQSEAQSDCTVAFTYSHCEKCALQISRIPAPAEIFRHCA